MTNSNAKGDRDERALVNYFDANGWAVMRAPASGSATKRELPDVLIGNGDFVYAFEAKSSGSGRVYIDPQEVEDLVYFSRSFGAIPRLAVKFPQEYGDPSYGEDWSHYVLNPSNVPRTDGAGKFVVSKDLALDTGLHPPEL